MKHPYSKTNKVFKDIVIFNAHLCCSVDDHFHKLEQLSEKKVFTFDVILHVLNDMNKTYYPSNY